MKKCILLVLCSSFFILNGGKKLQKKYPPRVLYQHLNKAFYSVACARSEQKNRSSSDISVRLHLDNAFLHYEQSEKYVKKSPQLGQNFLFPISYLKHSIRDLLKSQKNLNLKDPELFTNLMENTTSVMFSIAERYQPVDVEEN